MGKLNCGCSKNEEIHEAALKLSTRREPPTSSLRQHEKIERSEKELQIILIQSFFRGYLFRLENYAKLKKKLNRYNKKSNLDFLFVPEFEKWNKSFKINNNILDISAIPDFIESFYNKFFNFNIKSKVISIFIEDYEIPKDVDFEDYFKTYIIKNLSTYFFIGLYDDEISELKIIDEDSSEIVTENLGLSNLTPIMKPRKLADNEVKPRHTLLPYGSKENINKIDKDDKNDTSKKEVKPQSKYIARLKKKMMEKTKQIIQDGNYHKDEVNGTTDNITKMNTSIHHTNSIVESNFDRTKLPALFQLKFWVPDEIDIDNLIPGLNSIDKAMTVTNDDKIKKVANNNKSKQNSKLESKPNSLLGSIHGSKLGSKQGSKQGSLQNSKQNSQRKDINHIDNKYILFLKAFLEDVERNSKVTEEKSFYCDEDGTFYKGSYHTKLEEKYGFGLQYMMNKNKGTCYKYKGYFYRNKFHGCGILQKEDGYCYFGEFREGQQTGYGREILETGNYDGFFLNGKYSGYGVFNYTNNKVTHKGCYDKGFKNNLGILNFEDGSRYIGNFKFNQMYGNGFFEWALGHKYYGKWKDDKMQGKGKYVWKHLDMYIGQYDNDLRHGEGKYIFYKNNAELKGTWRNGKKEGNFILKESPTHVYQLQYRNDQQVD